MERMLIASMILLFSIASFASDKYCKAPIEYHGENSGYEALVIKMSARCEIYDQCVLTCIRAQCASDVGGGCGHMCSQINFGNEAKDTVLKRLTKTYHQREVNGGCKGNEI